MNPQEKAKPDTDQKAKTAEAHASPDAKEMAAAFDEALREMMKCWERRLRDSRCVFSGKSAGRGQDAVEWAILDAMGLEKAFFSAREKAAEEEFFHLAMINAQSKTRPQIKMAMMHLFLDRKTPLAREIAKKASRRLANRIGAWRFAANASASTQKEKIKALWARATQFDNGWALDILDKGLMRPCCQVHAEIDAAARDAVRKTHCADGGESIGR